MENDQITQQEADLLAKAELSLSDLTAGGLLNPEQSSTFLRKILDEATMLKEVRSVPMNAPQKVINKVGFTSRILKAAVQTTGSRALSSGDRSKPTTGKVTLNTVEVIAEVPLPYEVLEDNIERDDFQDTLLTLMAERAALDLEELVIQGDTDSGDDYLALTDGVLELATSNVVDAGNSPITPALLSTAMKAMPTKYLRMKSRMAWFMPHDIEQDYRTALASRQTGLGDAVITGDAPVRALGIRIIACANMPSDQIVLTDPRNIIFGLQRNIRIETDRNIQERQIDIVLTARVAVQLEEEDAVVKINNVAGLS